MSTSMNAKSSVAARLLHGLLLAVVALVFTWRATLPFGLLAVALGALTGSLLADRLTDRRYRLPAILLIGVALGGLGLWGADLLARSAGLARMVSPTRMMHLVEAIRWAGLGMGGALLLRGLALRFRAALAIEGSLAVMAVAATVSAHRDGMIARPLEVSDWFWRQGIDPVVAFVGVGLASAVLFAGVLASGRSARRTLVHLFLVLLLGLGVASWMYETEANTPRKNAVGAKLDKQKDGKRDRDSQPAGGGQPSDGKNSSNNASDLPPPPSEKGGRNRPSAIVVFYRDVRPATEVFYFRHAAFSQYNGFRLVEATLRGVDTEARNDFPIDTREVPGMHNEGLGRDEVAMDIALLSDHSRMFALIDPAIVEPRPNPSPARFRRAYHVVSQVLTPRSRTFWARQQGSRTGRTKSGSSTPNCRGTSAIMSWPSDFAWAFGRSIKTILWPSR